MPSRRGPRRKSSGWRAAALALGLVLAPASARAQSPVQREEARKLAGEALDHFKAGDFAAALEKFSAADARVPAPTLKLRVARCLDKLGRMREAADKYREVIAFELKPGAPPPYFEARKEAVPELSALLEQIPTVTVAVRGSDAAKAEVTVDGEPVSVAERLERRQLDPGAHQFEAHLGDRTAAERIELGRGEAREVVLTLPEPVGPPPPPPGEGAPWTAIGIGALALGGAGLIVGTVAGAVVLSEQGELEERCPERLCPPDAHEDARAFDTARYVSTAGFVVGLVGVAAGTTILLVAPSDEEETPSLPPAGGGGAARLRLGPSSLMLEGAF